MTQPKQSTKANGITIAVLTQDVTSAALSTVTQLRDASEKLTQEFVEASLSSQEAGGRATREYAGTLFKARQTWIKRAGELTEKAGPISAAEIEYPLKREIEEFHASILEGTKKAFEFFTAPLLAAAKR